MIKLLMLAVLIAVLIYPASGIYLFNGRIFGRRGSGGEGTVAGSPGEPPQA
jgi:hypothetical protein